MNAPLLDLSDPGLHLDPHPAIHRLRAQDPLHYCESLASWLVTRYDDVSSALRDDVRLSPTGASRRIERLAQADQDTLRPLRESIDRWMGLPAPDDHSRYRRVMMRQFSARFVEQFRPQIDASLEEVWQRALAGGRRQLEIVHDIAYPFGAGVVARLIGLPVDRVPELLEWSSDLVQVFQVSDAQTLRRAQASALAMAELVEAEIPRHAPDANDLMGALIRGLHEGLIHDEQEIIANCVMLVFVGFETTSNLIATGLELLFRHPEELARLRAAPELLRPAIEEMLRFDGPAFFVSRVAKQDFTWRDKHIQQGQLVLLGLGPANRDPEVFPDPDRFDITRPANRHLGFANGPYACLGASLARIEAHVAFSALLRFPELRRTEPASFREFRPLGRRVETLWVQL